MNLYEQYRPKTFDEVVGQEKVIGKLQRLAKRGLGGRVYWITGSSGTGKTTLARIIASEVSDDFAVIEIDGSDLTMDKVREYERWCRSKPIGGPAITSLSSMRHMDCLDVLCGVSTRHLK